MFFKEKKSMMTKTFYPCNRLFVLNRNFTNKHVNIAEESTFFREFCSKFQVFF